MKKRLSYGMVGGSPDAFIGGVHRTAIAFDNEAVLAAGCFSTDSGKNRTAGEELLPENGRLYDSYQEMATQEGARAQGIDFVCIVTPNSTHFEIAERFLEQGIHVLCEKPLCFTSEQALRLRDLARDRNLLFAVGYSYTGNPMVKTARELVHTGGIGRVISVEGQYLQEWLIDELGGTSDTARLSGWRTDPQVAGVSNCVGDIGSHIENTAAYITGLRPRRLCARLGKFGAPLDYSGHILLEFEGGAGGVFTCSQVAVGHQNDLALRIFGTEGSLEWHEEHPDELIYCRKGEAPRTLSRGAGHFQGRSASWARLPAGHPEGLYEAFANIYRSFTAALKAAKEGRAPEQEPDYPTVVDGLQGVRFIEAVVRSDAQDSAWVELAVDDE